MVLEDGKERHIYTIQPCAFRAGFQPKFLTIKYITRSGRGLCEHLAKPLYRSLIGPRHLPRPLRNSNFTAKKSEVIIITTTTHLTLRRPPLGRIVFSILQNLKINHFL
jgi:hypothetical protein